MGVGRKRGVEVGIAIAQVLLAHEAVVGLTGVDELLLIEVALRVEVVIGALVVPGGPYQPSSTEAMRQTHRKNQHSVHKPPLVGPGSQMPLGLRPTSETPFLSGMHSARSLGSMWTRWQLWGLPAPLL